VDLPCPSGCFATQLMIHLSRLLKHCVEFVYLLDKLLDTFLIFVGFPCTSKNHLKLECFVQLNMCGDNPPSRCQRCPTLCKSTLAFPRFHLPPHRTGCPKPKATLLPAPLHCTCTWIHGEQHPHQYLIEFPCPLPPCWGNFLTLPSWDLKIS
jgi:hypothetical protein